jgi:hypothetical protein
MAEPAFVVQTPHPVASSPYCSQCKTEMRLQRIDPGPSNGKDVHTYGCPTCGLIDRTTPQPGA